MRGARGVGGDRVRLVCVGGACQMNVGTHVGLLLVVCRWQLVTVSISACASLADFAGTQPPAETVYSISTSLVPVL